MLEIGVACKGFKRVKVVHREVLRWIVFATTALPLEPSCSTETWQCELLSVMIVAPRRELVVELLG